mmetsp:Transcript_2879/g.7850  ORF Transcript_2879/g.7850 Transcript_2879/m.7850 type:complete len:209 (-) Transcript_2879:908-1534(-)
MASTHSSASGGGVRHKLDQSHPCSRKPTGGRQHARFCFPSVNVHALGRRRCAETVKLANAVQQQSMKSTGGRFRIKQEPRGDAVVGVASGILTNRRRIRRIRIRTRTRRRGIVVIGARNRKRNPGGRRVHQSGRFQQEFLPFLPRARVGFSVVKDLHQEFFERVDDLGGRVRIFAGLDDDAPEAGLDAVEPLQRCQQVVVFCRRSLRF